MNIPGYKIDKLIAEGGMASVYLAEQESLARPVALKLLRKFDNPSQAQRFFNEGRIIASLEHRNIITIFDLGVVDERHYLAMEYLQGGDLKQRINRGMTPPEAFEILETLGSCLSFVHQQGIIHRDIKPENILFRRDGTVVLTDFGIAKQMESDNTLTMDGTTLGSPHYLSPEQASCKTLDGRADIYSLGIVFYEMLTGLKPFQGDSALDIIIAHLTSEIPLLPLHLRYCQPLLARMIAQEPEDRFASAAELVDAARQLRMSLPKHIFHTAGSESAMDNSPDDLTQTLEQHLIPRQNKLTTAIRGMISRLHSGLAGFLHRCQLKAFLYQLIPFTSRQARSQSDKPVQVNAPASTGFNRGFMESMLDKLVVFIVLIVTVLLTLLFLRQPLPQDNNDPLPYLQSAEEPSQVAQDSQTLTAIPSPQIAPASDMIIQPAAETDSALMQEQAIIEPPQTPNPPSEVKKPLLSAKAARKQAAAILKEKNLTLPKLKQAYDLYQITLDKDPRNPEALRGINIIANKITALESGQK